MNREIKFRAYSYETGMIYIESGKNYISFFGGGKFLEWRIYTQAPLEIKILDSRDILDVKQNTYAPLMQFVGLKDKNGKEIYEGDIVRWYIGQNQYEISEVVYGGHWNYTGFGFSRERKPKRTGDSKYYYWEIPTAKYSKDCEVIGNIYENPELLK